MRYILLILFLSLILNSGFTYTAENLTSSVAEVVKQFCQWEFEGNPDIDKRVELVFYSKNAVKKRKEKISNWAPIHFVQWEADPRIIVSSYKIESIEDEGEKQIATINYHVIGRSSKQDVFVVEKPHNEFVKIILKKKSGQWKVVDPSNWLHVSKEPTLKIAKEDMKRIEEILKDPKNVPYQRGSLIKLKKAVENIENMKP